jgi:hypothetical protein
MALLGAGLLAMQGESQYALSYSAVPTSELWRHALADAVTMFGRLPALTAAVCQLSGIGEQAPSCSDGTDWAGRLVIALGHIESGQRAEFGDMLRLLAVVQSDHEGANRVRWRQTQWVVR